MFDDLHSVGFLIILDIYLTTLVLTLLKSYAIIYARFKQGVRRLCEVYGVDIVESEVITGEVARR